MRNYLDKYILFTEKRKHLEAQNNELKKKLEIAEAEKDFYFNELKRKRFIISYLNKNNPTLFRIARILSKSHLERWKNTPFEQFFNMQTIKK